MSDIRLAISAEAYGGNIRKEFPVLLSQSFAFHFQRPQDAIEIDQRTHRAKGGLFFFNRLVRFVNNVRIF